MSFIKLEEDAQSNISIDLSGEDNTEEETNSLLEANQFLADQQQQDEVFYTKPSLNLLDGKFFQYIPEKSTNNKLVAYCMKCYPLPVEVKGYGSCTSNFISHLKRRHGDAMVEEYRVYMKSKKRRVNFNLTAQGGTSNYRKSLQQHSYEQQQQQQIMQEYANTSIANNDPLQIPNMPKLMRATAEKPLIVPIVPTLKYTSTNFAENVTNFFISALIPPNNIENPYFKKMCLDLNLPEQALLSITCQNLEQRIKQRYQETITRAMSSLRELEYYAVSIHLWSYEKNVFVGLVVHWLEQNLRRNSAALAIRQLEEENLNDQSIETILSEFGVYAAKIQATLIGNGKNYVQEFNELGIELFNIVREQELEIENCIFCDSGDIPIEHTLLNQNTLPAQLTCPAHLLNKALRTCFAQILAATNDTPISKVHAAIMTHCNMLWKAMSKADNTNFAIKPKYPVFNDWRFLISALENIAALNDKSQHLYDALRPTEISYLLEFLSCTAPIMEALNILQTEENSYFGIVLPCLFALKRNLRKVGKTQNLVYCQPLLDSYLNIITSQFSDYFELNSQNSRNAAIAALSYPRFKNQWFICVEPEQRVEILNLFKAAISEHIVVKPTIKNESSMHGDMSSAFFDFDDDLLEETAAKSKKTQSQISLDNTVEAQVLQFFAEENTDISLLNQYPEIKKVFIQYNTPLASLAIGENLFSSKAMNSLKRNHNEFNPLMEKRLILNAHLDLNHY